MSKTGGPTDQVPLHIYERADKIHRNVKKVVWIFDKVFEGLGFVTITGGLVFMLWLLWTNGLGWIIMGAAGLALLGYTYYWYNVLVLDVLEKGKENGVIDE